MAMDKNEKLVLFKKVPKYEENEKLLKEDRETFLSYQILERQKMLWREHVTVLEAREWADLDDKDANRAAEAAVTDSIPRIKSLKLEISALQAILESLKQE
jgi:hypothetical protein